MSRPSAGLSFADRRRLRLAIGIDDAKSGRSSPALRNGGRAVIELHREARVRARPLQLDGRDPRPRAVGRDPCPNCGARGDLGCDHFAPCAPVDMPRQAGGLQEEKKSSPLAGRFTEGEDARLVELVAAGLSGRQMAARLGRNTSSIYSALARLRRAGALADG
jgi:hypothetical protein